MIENTDIEAYLFVSKNYYGIYLFDKKKSNNLYKKETEFKNDNNNLDLNFLNEFLNDNIFKIEKQIGKFIKNIFLIIESENVLNINLGIKKKNYNKIVNKTYLENIITEAKDLFKENYPDYKIIHIILSNYYANGLNYTSFSNDLQTDNLCLELKFISIHYNLTYEISQILQKYQIKVIQYLSGIYIKSFFENENLEFSEKISKILEGQNDKEISVVEKNHKKKGFFEKFFQLFS